MGILFTNLSITALIYLLPPLIYLCLRDKPLSDLSIKKVSWLFAIITFIAIVGIKVAIIYNNSGTNLEGANIVAMLFWRWVVCKIFEKYYHSKQWDKCENENSQLNENDSEKDKGIEQIVEEKINSENFEMDGKNNDCVESIKIAENVESFSNEEIIESSKKDITNRKNINKRVPIITFCVLLTVALILSAFGLGIEVEKNSNHISDENISVVSSTEGCLDSVSLDITLDIVSNENNNSPIDGFIESPSVDFIFSAPIFGEHDSIVSETLFDEKVELKPAGRNEKGEVVNSQGLTIKEFEELNKYRIRKQSLTTPVKKGEVASIEIQGKPNTEYTLEIYFGTGSTRTNVSSKLSDQDGKLSWCWRIDLNMNAGSHRIVITGGDDYYSTTFVVY